MSVKLPRLLDGEMREVTRLHPSRVGFQLNMEPISTATMSLPEGEPEIAVGDFIELYLPGRSAGIFRVATATRDYGSGGQNVKLEHGIVTLGDAVVYGRHVFYGWDEGGDESLTVTDYMAVVGFNSQNYLVPYYDLYGKNRDGSDFRVYATSGTILPMITRADDGWKVLYSDEVARRVHVPAGDWGEWDGIVTAVNCRSRMLVHCTPYNNGAGRLLNKTTFRLRPSFKNYTYNFHQYETLPEDLPLVVNGEAWEMDPENGRAPVLFLSVMTPEGYTGWVEASAVRMAPGYSKAERPEISGRTQFETVAETLIGMAHNQDTRWVFGKSDFAESFGYTIENMNLLTALLSLPEKLHDPYMWDFDQSSLPWKLNLKRLDENNMTELRASRNLSRASVTVDRSALVTCVLPIGADGLTVESVNDGSPYILSEYAATFGHVEKIVEYDEKEPEKLYQLGMDYLETYSRPAVSATVSALDLAEMTGEPLDRIELGKMCRLPLPMYGVTMNEYITRLSWSDVYGAPEAVTVTLANRTETASDLLARMKRR